ncbi:hypothetical protein DVA67_006335 [Solirubrobacter sp. CPCC 204708]|uniref:DUF4234 domain-containing protein n=1 Tax=Solirubrobacter deserti TaxID=2282478 RepID=A0ABT4RCH1_9ACTN|nr:hypothetical protein [Solirubrobacter deserti]MBE2315585.1 hypothetical protein [Solirubrobacter deserti]MDA0136224.1 hypothetical protein [Solirubrobacter deserti]
MSAPMPGYYDQQQPPPGFHDTRVIRSVGRCFLLLLVSGGLWAFAWIYHTTREVSNKVNNPAPSPAFRTVMYVVPIANYVMWLLAWKDIEEYCKRARSEDFPMVLFFILTLILGFPGIFTFPIVQSRMNQAHRAATNGQATNAPMQTIDWVFIALGLVFWALLWLFIIVAIIAGSSS